MAKYDWKLLGARVFAAVMGAALVGGMAWLMWVSVGVPLFRAREAPKGPWRVQVWSRDGTKILDAVTPRRPTVLAFDNYAYVEVDGLPTYVAQGACSVTPEGRAGTDGQ